MTNISDDKIQEFLSLFDGDIAKAHDALSKFETHQKNSLPTRQHAIVPTADETIIVVQDVSKQYKLGKQKVNALRNVNLSIGKGEFVAITGASGSGKSTLLQMIGCLDQPTTGTITVEGQNTTKLEDSALSALRQKSIGFVFQSFYLQPFLRLNDNLAVPAMFTNEKKQDIDTRVEKLLQRVGLSDRSGHFPKELSGGQVQRAAIARALINNPSIVLADEPTGNLDSANSRSIIELFHQIRSELGTTIVVVTHDMSIANQADRVVELKDGSII